MEIKARDLRPGDEMITPTGNDIIDEVYDDPEGIWINSEHDRGYIDPETMVEIEDR
jgi:hypothetical protein